MSDPQHIFEAGRWLRFADEDLAAAKAMNDQRHGVPRQACWLAQQAAEKAIEAALVFLKIDFPRSHDLDLLRNLVPKGWRLATEPLDLAGLTEWAVEARYPGDWPEARAEDASDALAAAERVLDATREGLTAHGYNG